MTPAGIFPDSPGDLVGVCLASGAEESLEPARAERHVEVQQAKSGPPALVVVTQVSIGRTVEVVVAGKVVQVDVRSGESRFAGSGEEESL